MIDRLITYHKILGTKSSCNYELKPVEFYNVNTANLNDATQDAESRPTTHTAAVSTALLGDDDSLQNEMGMSAPKTNTVVTDVSDKIGRKVTTDMATKSEPSRMNSVTSHDGPQSGSKSTAARTNSDAIDFPDNILQEMSITSRSSGEQQEVHVICPYTQTEPSSEFNLKSVPSHASNLSAPLIKTVASDNVLDDISRKLSKLQKQQRIKFKRRLLLSENKSQRKENKNRKANEKYASEEKYRAKKKSYSKRNYSNEEIGQRKRDYATNHHYQTNSELRQKKKRYVTTQYRENVDFRQRQKLYITNRYKDNVEFRQRQKLYMNNSYRNNAEHEKTTVHYQQIQGRCRIQAEAKTV